MPFTADDIRQRVLYRDADVLILNKPAGLPVHAGTKITHHLEQWLDAVAFEYPDAPRLAHRLDRGTSGCLVLGRHDDALRKLGRLFLHQRVEKIYWAVVQGAPVEPAGRIDLPLRKIARETGARMEADPTGKPAVTDYRVVAVAGTLAWLELRPRTGRTHQLRAHCALRDMPILGDGTYGSDRPADRPLHLHARAVRLCLGPGGEPITPTAPLPAHLTATFERCGFRPEQADADVRTAVRTSNRPDQPGRSDRVPV